MFGFRSGSMGCSFSLRDLGFTTDGFSHVPSNVQLAESHRQLGMRREASVAKVPSNSNLDANCNLIVCQFPQVVASFAARNMDNSHTTLGRKWPKKV